MQFTALKAVIISLFYFAVVVANRAYRVNRHNYVINRHRVDALSTFESFSAAANDAGTKSAVLLETTRAIFGPQSSGHLGAEAEAQSSPQILEILRASTGGSGKP